MKITNKDDTKLLVNPPKKRRGIIGWKLSKCKPSSKISDNKSKRMGKRSRSTKPLESQHGSESYLSEASKMYNIGTKENEFLQYNKSYIEKNKTVEYENYSERLLKNDKIYFMNNNKIGVPIESRNIRILN